MLKETNMQTFMELAFVFIVLVAVVNIFEYVGKLPAWYVLGILKWIGGAILIFIIISILGSIGWFDMT